MSVVGTMFKYALVIGVICFLVGYVGPLIWAPDANQGPLLGIFITGPLGLIFGAAIGLFVGIARRV